MVYTIQKVQYQLSFGMPSEFQNIFCGYMMYVDMKKVMKSFYCSLSDFAVKLTLT